ncbi:MAG: alpha/beta hydrolase [Anaerolineae bacterium]
MSRFKKPLLITLATLTILAAGAYLAVGLFLHATLADISDGCKNRSNRPDNFADTTNHFSPAQPDLASYYMQNYETVTFPSRETEFNLSGWYIPGEESDGPAIISVHGIGSCKYSVVNLLQAGMLNKAGFTVLIMDVRDAGDSDYEDGLSAIGNEEYLDVLGAFDWLQAEKGHSADQIGVLGNSLGAATALIAFAQEPELTAAFVDSPFDNLPQIIREELDREGFPQFLYASGLMAARLRGDNINFNNPYDAIDKADGRSIFVTHGTADGRIGVHHTRQLEERASLTDANATFWIIDGLDHVKAVGQRADEYETQLVRFFRDSLKK